MFDTDFKIDPFSKKESVHDRYRRSQIIDQKKLQH
jgi:hypothetical protein